MFYGVLIVYKKVTTLLYDNLKGLQAIYILYRIKGEIRHLYTHNIPISNSQIIESGMLK